MNPESFVDVQGLSFHYESARRNEQPSHHALRQVSFEVLKGEIFGVLGPNGGGKTTLFRILSTLLAPGTGSVKIGGIDLEQSPHEIRAMLGVAFQSPSLDRKLTVEENLRHQGHLYGLRGAVLRSRIKEMLGHVGLRDRAKAIVETLSGGTARRVELAKTLLHKPGLLLLDEPSTGLDPGARRDLWDYLRILRREEGVTILLTTHLMEEAAACDRLVLLHHGEVVAAGTPDQLTSEVGGDVIYVRSASPQDLLAEVRSQFGCHATILDGHLRIERQGGHQFIPQLVEAFPGQIQSVSLGKPTLEDVFIRRTGHRLWDEGE